MFSCPGVIRGAGSMKRRTSLLITKRTAMDLAYKLYGKTPGSVQASGLPLIVLHGLLGSKRNWQSMCDKIAESTGRSVIGADLRNHGDSPHADTHTYPELAADVVRLLDSLKISRCSLMGHSMGGRTAMAVALTYPAKIENLIVVDISPVSTTGILNDYFPPLIKAMESVDFTGATSQAVARKLAKEQMGKMGYDGLDFLFISIGKKGDGFGWNCNPGVLGSHFSDIANFPSEYKSKVFDGPVLFIAGKESNYVPPDDIVGIKMMFPLAQLKYVDGAGHNVHAENPAAFHKLAHHFLTRT